MHGGPERTGAEGVLRRGAEPGWAGGTGGRRGAPRSDSAALSASPHLRSAHLHCTHQHVRGPLRPSSGPCCTPSVRPPETQPCPWRPQPGSSLQAPRGRGSQAAAHREPDPGPSGSSSVHRPRLLPGTRRSARCLDVPPPRRMARPVRGREALGNRKTGPQSHLGCVQPPAQGGKPQNQTLHLRSSQRSANRAKKWGCAQERDSGGRPGPPCTHKAQLGAPPSQSCQCLGGGAPLPCPTEARVRWA